MADNKITREVYVSYANKIVSVLKDEGFYEQFKKRVDKGVSKFKLAKKRLVQDISIDWIDTIESILPNLDTIVRNPRKFIVQEEDIVDVSLARSISTESVKYLAQHTNMISKVDEKTGDVTPSKILNITKEESFEIYENRFIYTLLLKLKDFVTMRYDKIKKASATQDVLELDVESRFNLPSKKITYRTEYFAQLSFDEVMRLDPDTLTKIERVAKIDRIITDFLSSSFAKSMRNSAPVRPPIMRTNVILKEPNFKKALTLWQFIETYQQTAGFSTSDEVEDYPIDEESSARLNSLLTLNTMVFESLYDQCETDFDMEDKEFADFLRVGEMDFDKDKLERDEYAQKLDESEENEDEEENIEEVKPQEDEEADTEIPPEEPEIEEIEKPQEIEVEVVVERPVEVERLKEMPPKADQEEVDLEPDAETFDQHLFEVRKVFKRPDDDKLKQEEIAKARDAIDRCLNSYRRIKQEELDERDRQERIRRRKEDIKKRAEAFRKQREELEKSGVEGESTYFGMDPFSFQKAKIAEDKRKEEEAKKLEKIKLDKHENLELEDKDTDKINAQIEEMEDARRKQEEQNEKLDRELDNMETVVPVESTPVEQKEEEPEPVQSVEEPQNTQETPHKKGKLRIAKSDEEVNPWSDESKPKKEINLTPVDENKVAVDDVHIKEEDGVTPWGEGADLGKLDADKEQKPKRKYNRKPKTQPETEAVEEPKQQEQLEQSEQVEQPVESAQEEEEQIEKPKSELRINLGGRIEDTQGMGISFKGDDAVTPWGDGAKLGKLDENKEQKPKRKYNRKPKQEKVEDAKAETQDEPTQAPQDVEVKEPIQTAETADEQPKNDDKVAVEAQSVENTPQQPVKKKSSKPRKNPNELSPTTLNQKYSQPTGRKGKLEAVDENKVGVGGIHFSEGSGISDPFGDVFSVSTKAEKKDSDDEA